MKKVSKKLPILNFKPAVDGGVPFEIADYNNIFTTNKKMSLTAVPHRHTFYEVLYYKTGKGTHFIDFVPYPLKGKLILFTEDFPVLNPLAQYTIEELPFFYKLKCHTPK